MHDESPTHAVATPRGLGWYLRCAVLVLCIAPYGVLMVLLLFRPVRWALVESGRLVYGIGFAASALLVVAVIAHVVGRAGHAGEPAPIPNGHLRRTGWGVRRRAVVVAFAVLAAGGEMAMHLAATDVHRYLAAEFPHAEALYANHDIANLVGQTVRVMLLKVRELVSENSDREILSAIAEVVPQAWRRLAEEQDQRIVPLTERELWVFVENPRQPALDIPRWGGLLDDWARAARVSALTEQGRRHVIRELSLTFAVSLREALKHDYEHGGKAWAAMQLDIMGELLRRSAAGAPMDDAAVKRALVDVSASISALDAIVARVRLEQTRYHEEVIVRFDNVRETLARIEKGVRALLAQGDAIQQMMLVQANPGLRQEEKLAQMLALSEGRPKELKRDPEPLQLPADLREFVERASAHASLIDQHRAKVLLGDLGAADRIAEQIEEMRRQGREQEDYMYFVTRGERFWAAEDYDSAADWFRRAVRIRGDDPRVLNSLALSLLRAKRSATYGADLTEAETWLEQALEVRQQLFPGGHPDVATSLGNVAFCLQSLGRSAEALPEFEAALEMRQRLVPGDHPDVAQSLNNVAACLQSLGRLADALPKYEAALEMRQRFYPGDHPDVAQSLNNMATCLQSLGRSAEALPKCEAALEMLQRLFPGDHPDVANALNNMATCLQSLGRSAEALPKCEAALEMRQRLFPGDHPDVANGLNNVAFCLQSLGRSAEALPKYEGALEMRQRLFPGDHPDVAQSLGNVAACLRSLARPAEALPKYEAALGMYRRVLPADHPDALYPQIGLAAALTTVGRHAEAEALLRDAAEQCGRSEASRRLHWRSVLEKLVRLYEAWHAAVPDKGYDRQAAEWRARLND